MNNLNQLLTKINDFKKDHALDLSLEEDLTVAIMNLVSLEEHFFFTGAKTGKNEYFDLIEKIREIRKSLMKKIVKEGKGEIWCISKHLLAASLRLIEVGQKHQHKGEKDQAADLFKKAYDLYSLFWAINLKVLDIGQVQKLEDGHLTKKSSQDGVMAELNELVSELADCCKE